ncbi:MAG: DUF2183 domain-containing protein [Chloroflexi bacterium]|nr:DUF2183 domain-containing protein [Chloroflexota bacterium]
MIPPSPTMQNRRLLALAVRLQARYKVLRWWLRRVRGVSGVQIVPYLGYGTDRIAVVRGRVIVPDRVLPAHPADSRWRNFRNAWHRFHPRELPLVRIRAQLGDRVHEGRTTQLGYFAFELALDSPPDSRVLPVALELPDFAALPGAQTIGQVLVTSPDARFGIISDLDDSIIRSDVVNTARLLWNTATRNAHTRETFPGVPELYTALHADTNPVFYVSTSPWNIYDMLHEFLALKGIPAGPLFLLHLGLTEHYYFRPRPAEYKLALIRQLLDDHPALPFLCFGDSTEEDAEVYLAAMRAFPGRIAAGYIRDVLDGARDDAIRPLLAEARAAGSEMLLVRDSFQAAEHAAAAGFLPPNALPAIRAACQR